MTQRKIITTAAAWGIGFLIFFPILWTFLTGFKTEGEAIASPPSFLFFDWNLSAYEAVNQRSDYPKHFFNSVVISFGSTLLGLLIAIPAAWAMAFVPAKRTKDVLMWMLSTKMLPPVGVLTGCCSLISAKFPEKSWKPRGWTGRHCAARSFTC
jgi:sorbitol/mannitol transport system permease protein